MRAAAEARGAPGLLAALLLAGCATARLDKARSQFYAGNIAQAQAKLEGAPSDSKDRVLFLMERGMIRQSGADYQGSIRDWLEAGDTAEQLDYLSVSRSSASMVANDWVLSFRGERYERTLLHAFAAKSYLALGAWDDAAVEARRIARALENLNGFPDDPYSHYLAGACFELIDDASGAALEYGKASKLLPALQVDAATGRIAAPSGAAAGGAAASPAARAGPPAELVCFVLIGRSAAKGEMWAPNSQWGVAPYAEIYAGDRCLGRSYPLTNTQRLIELTRQREAALKAAKTAARIVIKDAVAHNLSERNDLLGSLAWLALFAMETPDTRRWETLPMHLDVARVPCPANLREFKIVFKGSGGNVVSQRVVTAPLSRRGNVYVSFCRAM